MRVVKIMAAGEEAEGYECSFMETPPEGIDTECPICLLVLRQPSQVECCGRVFCTGCLQRALRDSDDRCPMCNARAPRVFTDQNFRRILAGFRVYCVHRYSQRRGREGMLSPFPCISLQTLFIFLPTVCSISLPPFFFLPVHRSRGEGERGCQWTGELRQLGSHLNPNQNQEGCLFVNVTCSLCGETMKRSSLSQHQESDCPKRSYSCPHCYIQSNYNNIVNSHLGKCPYYPCRCPHCYQPFKRCKLHLHINNGCILAPFPCPFKPVGCRENLVKIELDTHIKKSAAIHAKLLLEHGRATGRHIALYRSSLKEICRRNSDLSFAVVVFAMQRERDEKRINCLKKGLFGVIGVLILITALATASTRWC